ncbi:MAG: hypothetical protein ACYTFW_24550 [Planctomycetota bacterium]
MNMVKELMGHSNISTTQKFYTTVDRDHEKKAAQVVQQLLERNKNDVRVTYGAEIARLEVKSNNGKKGKCFRRSRLSQWAIQDLNL